MENTLSNIQPTSTQTAYDIFMPIWNLVVDISSKKITWLLLGIIVILFVGSRIWIRYKKSREGLLTYKTKIELQKSCKSGRSALFKTYLEQLYLPSWQSVLSVLIGTVILFLIAHTEKLGVVFGSLGFIDGNHYQNLIAIHAGIGAIIFALLIFIAESLRDDETKDRARVLLRESFLFPLAVAEVAGFFIFIWGDINFWGILPPLIVAILTIASLWRLLIILLSRSQFARKRLELLKDRIRRSINLAISERFGNNVLLQSLGEGKIELDYNPLSIDSDEKINRHSFYAEKVGTIVDIKTNKLAEFTKLVELEANRNGFTFYNVKAGPEDISASSVTSVGQASGKKFQTAKRQFLRKKFRDEIDDDQVLVTLEKRIIKDIKPDTLKKLEKLVKDSFVIKKQENYSEEVKLEINGLKDQFIAAISDKKLGKIEELVKTFISLSETFLEMLNMCGGGYSYDQARKERGELFGGWNEIRWLSESVREVYIKAIQSHDQEIIGDVAYMPVAIAIRAIKAGDQYVYQEFLSFPSYLYWLALKEENADVKKFMIDRSWRYLKEMSDYYIEYQLKREASDAESIRKYKDFTIPIFGAFQSLLKTAFDKSDFESFKAFLDQFLRLYREFDREEYRPSVENLRLRLELTTDSTDKENLRRKIDLQEELEKAEKDIKLKKRQVVFGLATWIFEKLRNQPTNENYLKFYQDIIARLPNSLPELTEIYSTSRSFETERFWDWDNWEMIPDGGVQTIDFNSKLDRLYCVKALQILEHTTEEAINSIVLPHSRDLAYLADKKPNTGSLINVLDAITNDSARWNFVLSAAAIAKIQALKTLLANAGDAQEKSEEEYLKTVKIDLSKVEEFKAKIKESFYESTYLRPVLSEFGACKDLINETPGKKIPSWGYNQIDDKAAFIKDWHVHYSGWGENYGRGMASSEDQLIFERMIGGTKEKRNSTKEELISTIEQILNEAQLENPVILQTLDRLYEYGEVKKSEAYISRYSHGCPKSPLEKTPGYMGMFKLAGKNVPVVDVFVRKGDLKNKVLIADLTKFGLLQQYSPIDDSVDSGQQYDIFLVRVSDLNENNERRQKIIAENPAWLNEYADKEGYLKQKVLINLYQKFEFKISDPQKAYCIEVADLPASDDDEE